MVGLCFVKKELVVGSRPHRGEGTPVVGHWSPVVPLLACSPGPVLRWRNAASQGCRMLSLGSAFGLPHGALAHSLTGPCVEMEERSLTGVQDVKLRVGLWPPPGAPLLASSPGMCVLEPRDGFFF